MRKFLASPTGWFAFLVVEILVLSALMRWLLRVVPDLSRAAFWGLAIALIAVVSAANYAIRRRYLSDL